MTRADTYASRRDAMLPITAAVVLASLAGMFAVDAIATGADARLSAEMHGTEAAAHFQEMTR